MRHTVRQVTIKQGEGFDLSPSDKIIHVDWDYPYIYLIILMEDDEEEEATPRARTLYT